MIERLNKDLRKLFLALGAVFALFKLIERIDFGEEPEDGFETHEFDDIW